MTFIHRSSSRLTKAIAVIGVLLLAAVSAPADSIFFKSGANATEFETKGISITGIGNNSDGVEAIMYMTENGSPRNKAMDTITRIAVDGEAAFTQAETDFAKGNLAAAGENYRKAAASTSKDWIKKRAGERLLGISSKTGDFAGEVAGFVDLVRKDPASAATHKPAIAGAKPDQLAAAIMAVNKGVADAKAPAKQVLYPFLVELLNAKGDSAAANKALEELAKINQAAPLPPGLAENVGAAATAALTKNATADVALTEATQLFGQKKYSECIARIMVARASFIDPDKQAKALYLVADAKAATATTPDALSEAALAYMKVVANFKSLPNAPVADALYKTAAIEEKLGKASEAVLIYRQLSNEYKGTQAEKDAMAAIARIQATN